MALWNIYYEDGAYAGSRNSGETAEQAVADWNNEPSERPALIGVSFDAEVVAEGRGEFRKNEQLSQAYGRDVFDYWTKRSRLATRAVQMREVWMDAGYARIPVAA